MKNKKAIGLTMKQLTLIAVTVRDNDEATADQLENALAILKALMEEEGGA